LVRANQILVTASWISEEPIGKKYTVIRSKDKLGVRRLTVKGEQELAAWDLCAISLPKHPSYNNKDIVEQLEGTYVALTFASEQLRDNFNEALKKLLKLRARQEEILRRSIVAARNMDNAIRHTVIRE
jgi:hypothetical protein